MKICIRSPIPKSLPSGKGLAIALLKVFYHCLFLGWLICCWVFAMGEVDADVGIFFRQMLGEMLGTID